MGSSDIFCQSILVLSDNVLEISTRHSLRALNEKFVHSIIILQIEEIFFRKLTEYFKKTISSNHNSPKKTYFSTFILIFCSLGYCEIKERTYSYVRRIGYAKSVTPFSRNAFIFKLTITISKFLSVFKEIVNEKNIYRENEQRRE